MKLFKNKIKITVALFMALTMLISAALPIGAFSVEQGGSEEGALPCWSVGYSDGVLEIKINAETVYDILKDQKLTREELASLIPQDILDAIEKGRELTTDDLLALASNYISFDDIREILEDMPQELISEYINLETLEELIEIDELISLLPLDDIFSAASAEAINDLVNREGVWELIFTDSATSAIADNKDFVKQLMEDTSLITDVLNDPVLKDKFAALLTDADSGAVNTILNDSRYADVKARLYDYLLDDGIIGEKILRDDERLERVFEAIMPQNDEDTEKQALIESFVTHSSVKSYLLTADLLSKELVEKLIDSGAIGDSFISDNFTTEQILEFVNPIDGTVDTDKLYTIISSDPDRYFDLVLQEVGAQTIIREIGNDTVYNAIMSNKDRIFGDSAAINAFIDIFNPLDNEYIMTALGGYSEILFTYCDLPYVLENVITYEKLLSIIDPADIVDIIGIDTVLEYVSVKEIIDAMGGASALLDIYSEDEIVNIFKTIGTDGIKKFITDSNILEAIDINGIATDILKNIRETADLNSLARRFMQTTVQIITGRIATVTVGNTDNPAFAYGQLSINSLLEGLISVIPITDGKLDFASALDTGISAGIKVMLNDLDESGENISYSYGIKITFIGDTQNLGAVLDKINNYIVFEIDTEFDDDGTLSGISTGLSVSVPKVFSTVYAELLNGELGESHISDGLRKKLLQIPNLTPADVSDAVNGITDEEKDEIYNAIANNLKELKEKVSSGLQDTAGSPKGRAVGSNTVNNAADRAKELLDGLANRETFDSLFDRLAAFLSRFAKSNSGNTSIARHYMNNGNTFNIGAGKILNLRDFILENAVLPDKLAIILKNQELSIKTNSQVEVDGLYSLTYTDENGNEFNTLVPEGTTVSNINRILGITLTDENGNPYNGNDTVNKNIVSNNKYRVVFHFIDEANKSETHETQTVFYNKGAESVTEPTLTNDGYSYSWGSYTLNTAKIIDVYYVKTPNVYKVTFECYDENGNRIDNVLEPYTATFTYGNSNITYPQIEGYNLIGAIEGSEFDENYFANGSGNQTVKLKYKKIAITDIVLTFTYNGETIGTFTFEGCYGYSKDDILSIIRLNDGNKYGALIKKGYNLTDLNSYDSNGEAAQTVELVYTGKVYTIKWLSEDTQIGNTVTWTFGDPSTYPSAHQALPSIKGHTVKWDKELNAELFKEPKDIVIKLTKTPNTYTITFIGNGQTIIRSWTYGTAFTAEPAVPYKYGHSGEWESYTLTDSDITVNAIYTLCVYTATFVADGETVGTVSFTVNDEKLTEPNVPAKSGYVGKWEDYSIVDHDITVNAIYTPISGGYVPDDTTNTPDGTTDTDDTTVAVAHPSGGSWAWIGLLLIALLVAGGLFGYYNRKNNKPDNTPDRDPDPEPDPEPTPESEDEGEPEPEESETEPEAEETQPVPEEPVHVVESVSVEEADELMSDDTAIHLISSKTVAKKEGLKIIVNIDRIDTAFEANNIVNLESLKEKKLVPQNTARIKILAKGNLTKPLNVEANAFSVQAVKMITLTGGTVTLVVVEE